MLPCWAANFSSQEISWLYLYFQSGHGRKAGRFCSIAWQSTDDPLLLPLPCPARVKWGLWRHVWVLSPYALGTLAFRCTIRAPAAEASSAACFWVSTDLLLAFWPKHPVPVDTNQSLIIFLFPQRQWDHGLSPQPFTTASTSGHRAGRRVGDRLLERGEELCRTTTPPGCLMETSLSAGKGVEPYGQVSWAISRTSENGSSPLHGTWKQPHSYMKLNKRNLFTTPPNCRGNSPSFAPVWRNMKS